MENSDRGNKVSKEDVQNAFAMLGAIMFLGLMAILYWIMELMLNPYKLEQFTNKVNTILEPFAPFFDTMTQVLLVALVVILGVFTINSLYIIWKGREHLSDVLDGGDK